jgi:hydrogenase 3 maturation protease
VGVGQELRGDDVAGLLVIRELQTRGARVHAPLFIEAGPLPESAAGPLRKHAADLAIFIDAADMGAAPGSIAWLAPEELTGLSALSHTLPLSVLFHLLKEDLGCETAILGIQSEQMEFDTSPSVTVVQAAHQIAMVVQEALAMEN